MIIWLDEQENGMYAVQNDKISLWRRRADQWWFDLDDEFAIKFIKRIAGELGVNVAIQYPGVVRFIA